MPAPVWGGPGGSTPGAHLCSLAMRCSEGSGAWQGREHPSPTVMLLKVSLPARTGTWRPTCPVSPQPALTRKRRPTHSPAAQPSGGDHPSPWLRTPFGRHDSPGEAGGALVPGLLPGARVPPSAPPKAPLGCPTGILGTLSPSAVSVLR